MAIATASTASCGPSTGPPNNTVTMRPTASLSARPLPATELLIVIALYSNTGRPDAAAATSATPRAWPSTSAEVALLCEKMASIATTSGACRRITAVRPWWIASRRSGIGVSELVRIAPAARRR